VCALVVLYITVAEVRNIIAERWGYVCTDSFTCHSFLSKGSVSRLRIIDELCINNNNINCNWIVTRWQWLFNTYTKHDTGLLLNLRREGYVRSM
jgi:hypothetical protein